MLSQGQKFRAALALEKPLQIVGVLNAYVALMATHVGFKSLYLSGAGVANSAYGLPDLGVTTLNDVLHEARRIVEATTTPLLVDIDTGWGSTLMIARTIREMERSGVAAVHMEDQAFVKRCGHRKGKKLVSPDEMVERIKAAVDARTDPEFVIMARTDGLGVEGLNKTIERALMYVAAGADMLFLEAATSLEDYAALKQAVQAPLLANITEFGQSPLWSTQELANCGVDMALYPLSANRAMNLAALRIFEGIRQEGTQKHLLELMQTREELYGFLNYEYYEDKV